MIELEATRLDGLVRDVLDLSRIEGGLALWPDLVALDLRDVVEPVVERLRASLGDRDVRIHLPGDLPPVAGDAVLLDAVVSNSRRQCRPPRAAARRPGVVRERRHGTGPRSVEPAVDDGGTGRPGGHLDRLFDEVLPRRTGRAWGRAAGWASGSRSFAASSEAMGGRVARARRSRARRIAPS